MLLDRLIPAIRNRMPGHNKNIIIQQDNAPVHRYEKDPDVLEACCMDGWNINISNQPARSPDLNILDLGFFNNPPECSS